MTSSNRCSGIESANVDVMTILMHNMGWRFGIRPVYGMDGRMDGLNGLDGWEYRMMEDTPATCF